MHWSECVKNFQVCPVDLQPAKTHLPAGSKRFSVSVHSNKGETAFGVKVATEAMEDPILEKAFQPSVVLEFHHHLMANGNDVINGVQNIQNMFLPHNSVVFSFLF